MNKCQLETTKHLLSTMNLKVAEIDKLERLAFQDTPALIDEIERLQHFERKAIYTIEENRKLRKALAFYANEENYRNISMAKLYSNVAADSGEIARKVLDSK